jgi:hypothetical protein
MLFFKDALLAVPYQNPSCRHFRRCGSLLLAAFIAQFMEGVAQAESVASILTT